MTKGEHSPAPADDAASSLSELIRLRDSGEITVDEFDHLKRRAIHGSDVPENAFRSISRGMADGLGFSLTVPIMAAALAAIVYVDHVNGSIFPDDWYCAVGAGISLQQPGSTEATTWSANNGCNASRPECATRWTHTLASSRCLHGSLWEAIKTKTRGVLS